MHTNTLYGQNMGMEDVSKRSSWKLYSRMKPCQENGPMGTGLLDPALCTPGSVSLLTSFGEHRTALTESTLHRPGPKAGSGHAHSVHCRSSILQQIGFGLLLARPVSVWSGFGQCCGPQRSCGCHRSAPNAAKPETKRQQGSRGRVHRYVSACKGGRPSSQSLVPPNHPGQQRAWVHV